MREILPQVLRHKELNVGKQNQDKRDHLRNLPDYELQLTSNSLVGPSVLRILWWFHIPLCYFAWLINGRDVSGLVFSEIFCS